MTTPNEQISMDDEIYRTIPRSFRIADIICDEVDCANFITNRKVETLDVIAEELNPINETEAQYPDDHSESSDKSKRNEVRKMKLPPSCFVDPKKRRKMKTLNKQLQAVKVELSPPNFEFRQRAAGSPKDTTNRLNELDSSSGAQTAADNQNATAAHSSSIETTTELMEHLSTVSRGSIALRAPSLSESTYERPLPFDRNSENVNDGITKSESHISQMCPQHLPAFREQGTSSTNGPRLQGGRLSPESPQSALMSTQNIVNRMTELINDWTSVPSSGVIGQLIQEIKCCIYQLKDAVKEQESDDILSRDYELSALQGEKEQVKNWSPVSLGNHSPKSHFRPVLRSSISVPYRSFINCPVCKPLVFSSGGTWDLSSLQRVVTRLSHSSPLVYSRMFDFIPVQRFQKGDKSESFDVLSPECGTSHR